jgi:hypothetical protein
MTITAKYPSKCIACEGPIKVGDTIEWKKGKGASHVTCPDSTPTARTVAPRTAARTATRRTAAPAAAKADGNSYPTSNHPALSAPDTLPAVRATFILGGAKVLLVEHNLSTGVIVETVMDKQAARALWSERVVAGWHRMK